MNHGGEGAMFRSIPSKTLGLVLTVALYLTQIPLSRWWLKRYRFGPAEWLWRSLTYRQLQAMR